MNEPPQATNAGRRTRLVFVVACVGWLGSVLVPPGNLRAAAALVALFLLVAGIGWLTLAAHPRCMVGVNPCLAMPVGFVICACGAHLVVWAGIPLLAAFWAGFVPLAVAGWLCFVGWLRRNRVSMPGPWCSLLFFAIPIFYVLPGSLKDAHVLPGGGYQWAHPDSAFHQAIVEGIASGERPLLVPGLAQRELRYHSASHALAALVMMPLGLSSGDALVRVVRPTGLLAFVAAVVTLATAMTRSRVTQRVVPAMGLLLVFFTFSPMEFFSMRPDKGDSFKPGLLPNDLFGRVDEYKGHLFGGSLLWGSIGLLTVAALVAATRDREGRRLGPAELAVLVAAASTPLNAPAGAGSVAALGATLLLSRDAGSLVRVVWLGGLFLVVVLYGRILASGGAAWFSTPWLLLLKAMIALSFLPSALSSPYALGLLGRGTASADRRFLTVFAAGSVGAFCLVTTPDWTERYGLHFSSVLLIGFAIAPAALLVCAARVSAPSFGRVLRHFGVRYGRIALGLAVASLSLMLARLAVLPPPVSGMKLGTLFLMEGLAGAIGGRFLAKTAGGRPWRWVVLAAMSATLASSTANFLPPGQPMARWQGPGGFEVDAGRATTLRHLRSISSPRSVVAVARHHWPEEPKVPRAYAYSALSGRPILLEGWEYSNLPLGFELEALQRDNAVLFSTTDPERAREIVRLHNVEFIVTEPGEDLRFYRTGLGWINREPSVGTMALYRCW